MKIVDIKVIKELFPNSEYPCLDYCKRCIKEGIKFKRLEVWNYDRAVPEADWIVTDVEKYIKNSIKIRKRRIRAPRLNLE